MRRVAAFLRLGFADKLLLLRCFSTLSVARLGLSLLPFRVLQRWMLRATAGGSAPVEDELRVAWGLSRASALVPGATCLTQAIAGQFMLGRMGYRTQIRVGVRQGESGRLLAHAWLISGERVVLGGSDEDVRRFTKLTDFDIGPA